MGGFSVNKVTLLGQLGRDAETKFIPSGTAVTKFSIATERSWKNRQTDEWDKETTWHNVVMWQKEQLGQYLVKGARVYVEGRISTRNYDDKDGKKVYVTEIVAENVIFLGERTGNGSSGQHSGKSAADKPANSSTRQQQPPPADDGFDGMGVSDDDVPF